LVEVVYREREGHAVAVRIEPRWPAYHLSILYLKGCADQEFHRLISDCDSPAWEHGEARPGARAGQTRPDYGHFELLR
jgi:hypothetical protein